MRLSQRADYSVRMMVDVASMSNGQRTTINEIARRQDVPEPFMAKIVSHMADAGLVATQRGTGGGLTMARPADSITLLEIVEAIDGPIALTRCTLEPSRCSRSTKCAVHPVWEQTQRQLKELLSHTRLSDIAQAQKVLTPVHSASGG